MRTFLVLICSLAFTVATGTAQETQQTKEKKKSAPTRQVQSHPGKARQPAQPGRTVEPGKSAEAGKAKGATEPTETHKLQEGKAKGFNQHKDNSPQPGNPAEAGEATGRAKQAKTGNTPEVGKHAGGPKPSAEGKAAATGVATGNAVKPQHFNLPKQPNTAKAPPVKFQQGRQIEGSQNWQGQQYAAFRNYHSEWHDEDWWHGHYGDNIVFVFGAPYFLNAGYWYPAWGYTPNAYYAWDGPIYAYNNLPPDQVIANVQTALQQQGYYQGDVDGLIGPLTRDAIAGYQRDHGLYITSAIDEPTLQSLGMA
jgi:hypothetical protein